MKKIQIALFIALAMCLVIISLVSAATLPVITKESCGRTYTVIGGDNLTKIAQKCDTTVEHILLFNPDITNPNYLLPGQEIILRMVYPTPTRLPK